MQFQRPHSILAFQWLFCLGLIAFVWVVHHQQQPLSVALGHSILMAVLVALVVYRKSRLARFALLFFFIVAFLNTLPILVTQYQMQKHFNLHIAPLALQVLAIMQLLRPCARTWFKTPS